MNVKSLGPGATANVHDNIRAQELIPRLTDLLGGVAVHVSGIHFHA